MCLAIPGKILSIEEDAVNGATARVEVLGTVKRANVTLLESPRVGEYVLIHAGFAIERVDTESAEETLAMIEEL
ncbi:MAG: HypC/HybG/HupF family hydrogenase formation chaperone [Proteobacteria bacterium]|nr:HypC/HybG/HupF family hydrogenase formation chaperone [Pseudomonadota bacterium]